MKAAQLLALTIILVGCGATVSESPSLSPTTPESETATATASPAASASQVEAAGVFIVTPGVMDCPGEPGGLCPSYTVAEAIDAPRQPGIPILVVGHVLIEPDGTGWYCETLTDSAPPQCAGDRLEFESLDFLGAAGPGEGFQEQDGVRWSDEVQQLGEVVP